MKCPYCAVHSLVLATRTKLDGYTIERNHKCANEHRFKSVQIVHAAYCAVRSRNARIVKMLNRRTALWRRDQEISKRRKSGEFEIALAVEYGLTVRSISRISRKHKT